MSQKAIRKYTELRTRLLRRGFTVRSAALLLDIPVGSAYNSVKGIRMGAKASANRLKIEEFANGK